MTIYMYSMVFRSSYEFSTAPKCEHIQTPASDSNRIKGSVWSIVWFSVLYGGGEIEFFSILSKVRASIIKMGLLSKQPFRIIVG